METYRSTSEAPLESWKEIGAYLNRNEVTARRWEKEEGLPVHRQTHKRRASVYAYRSELDAWRATRKLTVERVSARPWWRPLALGTTLLLCLVMVGNGVRPQLASAQQIKPTARQVWSGPEVEPSGTISADGRYLSFIDWSTGDLAVRDLRAGKNRRITDTGGWEKSGDYPEGSVISPDGNQIAYAWFIVKDLKWELRVLPMNGAQSKMPRVLLRSQGRQDPPAPVGWTPDGRRLLVMRYLPDQTNVNEIGMIDLKDGSYRALKSSRRINFPRLSPDGRWVAYGGLPDEQSQVHDVYVLSTEGTQETDVVPHPANENPLAWSPDGTRLYFISNRTGSSSVWSIGMASGKPTGAPELVRPDTGPIESMGMTRAGVLYYLVRGGGGTNIYTAELGPNGTVSKPVLWSDRFVNSTQGASISPDGKSLAYYSVRSGPEHLVIVRSLETGKERDLRQELRLFVPNGSGPMWFPDSRSLLTMTCDLQKLPNCGFYRLHVDTGETQLILNAPRSFFKLSPDGKTLFYITPTQTSMRLTRYDLETRREAELSANKWIMEIAVSPDSKQLAYLENVDSGAPWNRSLAVMPATGGPAKELYRSPDLARYNALEWTPDQRFLAFAKTGPGNSQSLWRVPAAGGPPEPLGLSQAGQIREPQVTPDGKRLFYTVTEPNANEVWALENFIPVKAGK